MMVEYNYASTGIPGLDRVLDNLRSGDNVVWQVRNTEDYQYFVNAFVNQALIEKRKVVYLRFAHHSPVLDGMMVKTYRLNPKIGFEAFSMRIYEIIEHEGANSFFVFDSLSDLLYAWATDLMIGNFFRIICPYIYKLGAIGYFAIISNRNSYHTMERIRNTTQLLLDVYQRDQFYYIHPLKVNERYSPTMFLPHVIEGDDLIPITNSYEISSLFARVQCLGDTGRKLDYWDRISIKAQELQDRVVSGEKIPQEIIEETTETLCQMMIGKDERILGLARRYFSLKDLLYIRSRLIGTGMIGGKTVGMLLARSILRDSQNHNWHQVLETHDSFFVGSDVYYTYLIENDCWDLILEHKNPENYYSTSTVLRQRLLDGVLPEAIREHFTELMDYFGQAPIIVRSSSLLEDSFGHAFAGKYESIFCVNQGNPQERCRQIERAIKAVYASTMNEDALTYRERRGMAQSDEQMALLIQRVSGSHRGRYFFPDMAGVALSHNFYVWQKKMDQKAGMMRLVVGLGTRAVARSGGDYTRIVALDQPLLRPESAWEDIRRFSQHQVDLLDTVDNKTVTVSINTLGTLEPEPGFWRFVAQEDTELQNSLRRPRMTTPKRWVLTFNRVFEDSSFSGKIREMLRTLEHAYNHPVDIEFTANLTGDTLKINLLQCRPLQTWNGNQKQLNAPSISRENLVFASKGNFMGANTAQQTQWLILVDSKSYSRLSEAEKYVVARLVGRLNRKIKRNLTTILIGPGRWGSTTPSLGVPVSFAEICNFSILVEVAGQGYLPEISFGTHFFQDLVENQMGYVGLYPDKNGHVFAPELLDAPNLLGDILPGELSWQKVIKVMDFSKTKKDLWFTMNINKGKVACYYAAAKKSESCLTTNIPRCEILVH